MQQNNTVAQSDQDMVNTGMRFREDLHRRAKQACLDHNTTIQALCNEGLELRLAQLDREIAKNGKK